MNQGPDDEIQSTVEQKQLSSKIASTPVTTNQAQTSTQPLISVGQELPPTPPAPRHKGKDTTIIATILSIVLILSGTLLGTTTYSNHQNTVTAQADASATALVDQAYARATVLAQATTTYIHTHYPFSSNLVLNDPLLDDSNAVNYGWDVNQACTFTNGSYEVTETQANFIQPCAAQNTNFANFTYEIQMTIKSGGTGASGGILFRANMNTDQLYLLELDTNGRYTLSIRTNSTGANNLTLQSGTIASFGFNQTYTIGVVANGSQISFYIDRQQVSLTSDSTYTSGVIGVISEYGSSTTVVDYNNARVWQL